MSINSPCLIIPSQQIISTSIGAMCTALFMVENASFLFIYSTRIAFRHRSMLFEFACNANIIHTECKMNVMSFDLELMIMFARVSIRQKVSLGSIDR